METPKKKQNRRPSARAILAARKILENHGNVSRSMIEAGYSPNTAHTPQNLTTSQSFAQLLDEVGLTDKYLSQKYQTLSNSSRIEREVFYATRHKKKWIRPTKEEIKAILEGTPEDPTGCRLIYVKPSGKDVIAIFRVPDNVVQKGILEMAGKVKRHFAPVDVAFQPAEANDEEMKLIDEILKTNKK